MATVSTTKECRQTDLPFAIQHSAELGRYLSAACDFQKGDIIFQEDPIVLAPQKNSVLICPGCYSPQPEVTCPKCGWPMCSLECPKAKDHEKECENILKSGNCPKSEDDWVSIQDALMVFRCLSVKQNEDTEQWNSLQEMDANWQNWSKSPLQDAAYDMVRSLRLFYGLEESKASTEDICRIVAILDINAYEVKMPGVNIQGLYKVGSLVEHCCMLNAFKITSYNTLQLTLRAGSFISKGCHISTTYCDTLTPTSVRQRHVQWSKFFTCRCPRCNDPSELGSHMSSLICPDCGSTLLPVLTNPTDIINEEEDDDELWKNTYKDYQCPSCTALFPAGRCEMLVGSAESYLQSIEPECENIPDFEDWLSTWTTSPAAAGTAESSSANFSTANELVVDIPLSTFKSRLCNRKKKYSSSPLLRLHPQHASSIDACHTLFLLYSAETDSLSDLSRKNELGTHLLQSTASLSSGIPLFRGTVMVELAITKAALLAKYGETPTKAQTKLLDRNTAVQEITSLLRDAIEHLQYEPEDQPEGKLRCLAFKLLEDYQTDH